MFLEAILDPTLGATITNFVIAICCTLTARFLYRSEKKLSYGKKIYLLFWFFAILYFLLAGTIFIFNRLDKAEITEILSYIVIVDLIAQGILGGIYLLAKFFKKTWLRLITGLIFLLIVAFLIISSLGISENIPRVKLISSELQEKIPVEKIILIIIVGFFLFSIPYILYKGFKTGDISFSNLSYFFEFYAFIIYSGLMIIRLLYFLPNPSLLDTFFIFVPFLMYLSFRNNHDSIRGSEEKSTN